IFTVAAGNSGDDRSHGSGTAAVGVPSTAKVQLHASSGVELSVATIDLWYRGADHLRLAVIGPDGREVGAVDRGHGDHFAYTYRFPSTSAPVEVFVRIHNDQPSADGQTMHAWITLCTTEACEPITSTRLQHTWTISLSAMSLGPPGAAPGPAPGRWDGWIAGGASEGLIWLDAAGAGTSGGLDLSMTLTEPATARRAVVAGAYVSKATWTDASRTTRNYPPPITVGEIAPVSSRGTTRDGRQKPDVAAPGQVIVAARSSSYNAGTGELVGPNRRHRVLYGTSMAAAHTAGAIALLLQARPDLTPEGALVLLRDSALRDSSTGSGGARCWDATYGAGKLRALGPVRTALALPAGAIAPEHASASPPCAVSATATPVTPAATATPTRTPTPTMTSTPTITPTPSRTPTPTRTAMPTPVNELIIRLALWRPVPSPAPAYATDVTLSIYPTGSQAGSRTPIATFTARTDTTGAATIQVPGGLDGRYDVVAKPAGAISRELNGVNIQRGVAEVLAFGASTRHFAEGDADGDDVVGVNDVALLQGAFGQAAGASGYEPRTDFDRDGAITIRDFSLLARSYTLAGPIDD
ncbi:MAG: S8 family serine peptidase, partial [Chloroflexota bacterium]